MESGSVVTNFSSIGQALACKAETRRKRCVRELGLERSPGE